MDKLLHITNGDAFTSRLESLNLPGTIMIWREMLCEGPATELIFSEPFNYQRASFLRNFTSETQTGVNYNAFADSFYNLNIEHYNGVFLWFEYDLFCHVNLAAAVHFLSKRTTTTPLYLICSGTIDDSEKYYGLAELSNTQILEASEQRILLTPLEIKALVSFWDVYTSEDHTALKNINFNTKKLPYLNSCIEAHFQRFPKRSTGINKLERMVLQAIYENEFVSEKQVCHYLLKNQQFYGFGDLQWITIIARMRPFFTELLSLTLNTQGEALLSDTGNAYDQLKDNTMFGGALKYDYFYNANTQQLEAVHEA